MTTDKNKKIALHCQNITKTYGSGASKVQALRGVDLDVYEGELLMLVGPSGCGKTTFVSVVTTLLTFDSGVCDVLGKDLNTLSDAQKVHFRGENIGFVFQSFNLLPSLNAMENVAIPLLIAGVKRETALNKAKEIIDAMGLESKHYSKPNELSGGEQQRVAVARAIVHDPKLIVCDEPTSSLDHESGQMVMKLLKKISEEEHRTLIVVTHDNRIYEYADRMAHMEDGKITRIEENKENKGNE
ncbi:MAG: ABC transporter ATP-binding protein [Epsilonproteobacteria bacterium (ex Lamellibrachia satsuma)]|nr:MAG: ABC transporter ATP-binding protein [Epsilonproteobacteria bacterium (ex Lamellibrachia satsuma)]